MAAEISPPLATGAGFGVMDRLRSTDWDLIGVVGAFLADLDTKGEGNLLETDEDAEELDVEVVVVVVVVLVVVVVVLVVEEEGDIDIDMYLEGTSLALGLLG